MYYGVFVNVSEPRLCAAESIIREDRTGTVVSKLLHSCL